MIAPDNKASFLLRNRSALFRNISKAHHTSPHKSVPLRELWFLSIITYSYMSFPCIVAFPSPCGDYGSYHVTFQNERSRSMNEFPSPCGDYGSYRPVRHLLTSTGIPHFRPLAGIMVLIGDIDVTIFVYYINISVPLRGLWFLSRMGGNDMKDEKTKFPSPCGDYGSYQNRKNSTMFNIRPISVPLRGLWFLS